MSDKIVVLSTCGSAGEAAKIARALIQQRLAACVNIVPRVLSIYRWEGAMEDSEEWLLIIKSSQALFERLDEELRKVHSNEVPEIVALPVVAGSASYLAWMSAELE
jgi:periplasmic divalent cation tolerance protein